MRLPLKLILLALPSLLGSVLLMSYSQVGMGLLLQQVLVGLMGCGFVLWRTSERTEAAMRRRTERDPHQSFRTRIGLITLSLIAIGLLLCIVTAYIAGQTGSPARWLKIADLRLYFAGLIMPASLLLIAVLFWIRRQANLATSALSITIAASLAAQPDASQITAFSLGMIFIIWHSSVSMRLKSAISLALIALSVWTWLQADPLQPVPYVEGVIQLAATVGVGAMLLAILSVAMIPLGLFFIAIKYRISVLIPIALYYVVIMICAYLGLTPMPLLGFGAGPVLGYFLATGLAVGRE
ncbi:hypothetical protein RF679_06620 [Undibacterium cyanobacteriorum]|uniref:DUF4401 domain-containing protein n=1 Tax=Undibacterium cyanobacteriorum TaxID=3073561 RepID=A0ABY9RL71_9BURK|nr:hypothetical protein [Undibacterium sp. 20NA77.5]WMW81953.1 hypothetical protein RF679_06620 [Undibacterium sp. 20NA77.5]